LTSSRCARNAASLWCGNSGPGSSSSSRTSRAKATIAEHIRYALNHWDGLTRFLDDRPIELDINIVARSIRPFVLNRKNALFAGHDQGAENWPASLRSSRPAISMASTRRPISATC
jgi:hypothetical protein